MTLRTKQWMVYTVSDDGLWVRVRWCRRVDVARARRVEAVQRRVIRRAVRQARAVEARHVRGLGR